MKNLINKINIKDKNKLKKVLPVILLLFLITIIIGVTYAAYLVTLSSGENSITTGLVSMSYTESTNVISLENALPISDSEGKTSNNYFDFSVTSNLTLNENNPNTDVYYSVEIEPLSTNTLSDSNIKLYLEDTSNNRVIIDSRLISNITNYTLYNTKHTHKYNLNTITTNYRLRAWIDYNTDVSNWNSSNTYEYKFRINVNGDVNELSPNPAFDIIANSVTSANISYLYGSGAKQTIDGIAYNVNDNGVFLYDGTDDNNGDYPIYYYRGNVTNNNVLFGGFCWEIVRTTSTGGIKLIYNGIPLNGTCSNSGSSSVIGTDSAFNSDSNSPAYVGYMYGTIYEYGSKSPTGTIIYGNDVTYSNGTYTLVATKSSTSWSSDRTTLANGYHYTCFNTTGTCTSIYYITYFGNSSTAYYLTFTGGDTLDTAKTKMFTNTTDSVIKTTIDNWYSENLTSYTNYLEDTIFCNDRSSASDETYIVKRWGSSYAENGGALSSKDTNAVSYSFFKSSENTAKGTPSLQCTNKNDQFSLSTTNGGISGYGNNALTYPVGLLTLDEAELSGLGYGGSDYDDCSFGYLGKRVGTFWLLSPSYLDEIYSMQSTKSLSANCSGFLGQYSTHVNYPDIRPVISLKLGTTFSSGSGTTNSPYIAQ